MTEEGISTPTKTRGGFYCFICTGETILEYAVYSDGVLAPKTPIKCKNGCNLHGRIDFPDIVYKQDGDSIICGES